MSQFKLIFRPLGTIPCFVLQRDDGAEIAGPADITVAVTLSSLPHFVRVPDGARSAQKEGAQ